MSKTMELIEKFKAHMTWDDKNKYWICPEENLKMFEEELKINSCSVCNPKTLCEKHRISQAKIMAEISESLNLEHDAILNKGVKNALNNL